ncbi:MAG TPA: glycerol-3-phosphate dehydrogenase [Burkholderiales bacterium]|nr:glycerol-3-phosphate dehydrogenase [Burkholderiales bacterium]
MEVIYDLLVIGGGINGAGIARDAAGRGLAVSLVEKADLASATSSASSKLIHGGLRYLEHFEFRLVAEALAEREIMLRIAGHLTWPTRFVAPHVPELRPRWMIRLGLFLYDHLARRSLLAGSQAVRLDRAPYASGLRPELKHGFVFSDCRVDDARLVVVNALDAAQRGARILVRTECVSARRADGIWHAQLSNGETVPARAVVNAAGPWVKEVLNQNLAEATRDSVRLVKGSHIVLPRLYEGEHAFILQNDDRRVVFMIPYEERFTLLGTTDVDYDGDPASPLASEAEADYLCRAAGRYLARMPAAADAIWSYAGVRPLYDDGSADPSAITRDYTLRVDDAAGTAPVLSVFGGKITTYRRLAESALEKLAPYFPNMKPAWTAHAALPGSDFAEREAAKKDLFGRYSELPAPLLQGIFRRHGTLASRVLGDGRVGEHYGAGLTEREVAYFTEREWARSADDVLWRRTKCGLHMNEAERRRVVEVMGR